VVAVTPVGVPYAGNTEGAMLFKHVYDDDLAQGSYLIGCQATGDAVVVDPGRDVQVFIDEAARRALRIVAVTETHVHADYLSGSRELAHATGATLYLSDEGDADWKYGIDAAPLYDGSVIRVGNVTLGAIHTPGHTSEHLSFLVTDRATTGEPGFILTGDFVFVGDVGRPDLLDEAAGFTDTRFAGAKALFRSLAERFLTLPDHVQVWPGHGAGSACGKSLGAVASTTVGYERRVAWWVPYVEAGDEAGFVAALLEGQPDAPLYFGRMKRHNKAGPALLGELAPLAPYDASELARGFGERGHEDLLLVDVRPSDVHARAAVPGAVHVPSGKSFATYASYVIDPERDTRPLVLLGADPDEAERLRRALVRVGIDRTVGYAHDLTGLPQRHLPTVTPERLPDLPDAFLLDVRTKTEYEAGHVPGATQIHAGRVMWRLDRVPEGRTIVTHCQSGARSAVVASALRAAGYDDVRELQGSYEGWAAAQRSAVRAPSTAATGA
jgi:hydroxyacylglutathione hydrolase